MYLRSALLLAFCCLAMQWVPSESVPFVIPWYGRWILPTVGEVWPKPQQQTSSETFFILRPTMFQFQIIGERCDIIDEAIRRYYQIIFYPGAAIAEPNFVQDDTPVDRGFCGGWMTMMDPRENRQCVVVCVLKLEKSESDLDLNFLAGENGKNIFFYFTSDCHCVDSPHPVVNLSGYVVSEPLNFTGTVLT